MEDLLVTLTLLTALGCGLVAGVFFAFSTFVMNALARLHPTDAIAAMQSINVVAVRAPFMALLFGTAVSCGALAVWALADWNASYSPWLLTGAGLYLVGSIGFTMGYHVPRNEALATVRPTAGDSAGRWTRYASEWTKGNHLRTASSAAASVALTIALVAG